MSETVYEMIEGRPQRIVQIVLYIGGAPVITDLTTSPDERALVMTYLRGEAGLWSGSPGPYSNVPSLSFDYLYTP